MDDTFLVDEQGDWWPPATALAAFLHNYGGDPIYDGTLVEVSAWLAESGYFETIATSPIIINGERVHEVGEVILATVDELRPINKHTQKYLKDATNTSVVVYDMDVYDLRDALSLIDVNVTADAVAEWTGEQRKRIWLYASAVIAQANDHRVKVPTIPKELVP